MFERFWNTFSVAINNPVPAVSVFLAPDRIIVWSGRRRQSVPDTLASLSSYSVAAER